MRNIEIEVDDVWNKEKTDSIRDFITSKSKEQSEERLLKNKLLSIKFKIEDYINAEEGHEKLEVLDFVKMYLKVLNITQKRMADLFEMKDSNLHKYLIGERKLNTDLILKLSSFSHLEPEHWIRIEFKNELIELKKEKEENKNYNKYDYRNLLMTE